MNTGIYLLDLRELLQGAECAVLFERAFSKMDEARREKTLGLRNAQARAAGVGAGLLLQRAAQEFQDGGRKGWLSLQSGGWKDGQEPGGRYTVSGLLAELDEPLPLIYRYGERGKPYFEDIPLYFNLSHSGDYVLCAVSEREVGADIQRFQPVDAMKLAKRFFPEPECEALSRCEGTQERQELFFRLWARKEAYGKLTGEGVVSVLDRDMRDADADWQEFLPPEGYAAAVCTAGGAPELRPEQTAGTGGTLDPLPGSQQERPAGKRMPGNK